MKNVKSLALIAIVMLVAAATDLHAIPQMINYQGSLLQNGKPVNGTKSVRFRIYNSAEGGNYLWEEVQSVTFENGSFNVLLGSTEPIPKSVFNGSRRWLSVAIEDSPEILPRAEIVSVGYCFYASKAYNATKADTASYTASSGYAIEAGNADLLDDMDSSEFASAHHSHDSRYYKQSQLNTSDGTPPNEGPTLVHWDNLGGVPSGFADGVDDAGPTGSIDHGSLIGLLDNDHPQYVLKDTLRLSDGSPPNQGLDLVHWDVLTGVPSGFTDGTDDITTDASLITSGTMAPERIQGVAVVNNDPRLLTVSQKNELTGGGMTTLHSHIEIGDISEVIAGPGLSGGGTTGDVEISHASDASTLPFAHHYPPAVASVFEEVYESTTDEIEVVAHLDIDVPADGFLLIHFSATQLLDVILEGGPPHWVGRRYVAEYGIAVDTTDAMTYFVRSSMQDTLFGGEPVIVPSRPIGGSTVVEVTQGTHTVYLVADLVLAIDADARNELKNASLTVTYYQYDLPGLEGASLSGQSSGYARSDQE